MNITRSFSIRSLINFFILSFQQLGFPVLVYFSTFIVGFGDLIKNAKSKIGLSILVTIILGILSLSLRGFPLDQIIYQLRFFFGPLIISYFLLSSNIFSRKKIVLAFIIWSLIELLCLLFFKSHPFYISSYFAKFSNIDDSLIRTDSIHGFFRILGPTLNSSLAGTYSACFSILAIFDYHLLDPNPRASNNSYFTRYFIIASSFLILILTRSGTGFISLLLLLLFKSIQPIIKFTRSLKLSKKSLILTVLMISIFLITITSFNISESVFYRSSQFYINLMIERKLESIDNVGFNLINLIFGLDYNNILSNSITLSGGDFLLLVFVSNFGLFLVIPFLRICWELAESTKIYFIILLISSIHYGTIFAITGQAIFTIVFLYSNRNRYDYIFHKQS